MRASPLASLDANARSTPSSAATKSATDHDTLTTGGPLTINDDRLWQSLMTLARIGATDKGGVCRLALTDLDRQGREVFIRWAREAGRSGQQTS